MDINTGCVHVLGTGHLAAAARRQLRAHTPSRGVDCACTPGTRTLLVACADFECRPSFADANRRALTARSPLLFACLAARAVKVGPLVVPFETACFECHPTQRWDFSLADIECQFLSRAHVAPADADAQLVSLAQLGGLILACEVNAIRLGAELTRLGGAVVDFDPPCLNGSRLAWPRAPNCPVCGSAQSGIPAMAPPRRSA